MSTCEYPRCDGHLGKFDSCLTERLWEWSLDGFDDTTGSTEAYGHFALIIAREPTMSVSEYAPNRPMMVPAGNYLVESRESGAVYLNTYATEAEAHARYNKEDSDYADWLDVEDF